MAGAAYDYKQYSTTSVSEIVDPLDILSKYDQGADNSKDDSYFRCLKQDQDIEPDTVLSDEDDARRIVTDGFQIRQINNISERTTRFSKRSQDKYQDIDQQVLEVFKTGTVIAGKYEVLCPIARGKYGQVFQCKDL